MWLKQSLSKQQKSAVESQLPGSHQQGPDSLAAPDNVHNTPSGR